MIQDLMLITWMMVIAAVLIITIPAWIIPYTVYRIIKGAPE